MDDLDRLRNARAPTVAHQVVRVVIDHLGFYEALLRPPGVRLLGSAIEPDGRGRVLFGTGPRSRFLVIAKFELKFQLSVQHLQKLGDHRQVVRIA